MVLEDLNNLEVALLLLALSALGCFRRGHLLGCQALARCTLEADTQGSYPPQLIETP